MSRISRQRKEQVCYYVINRGSDGIALFKHHHDYRQYLRLVKKYKNRFRVQIL
jgi:hypothetical protein